MTDTFVLPVIYIYIYVPSGKYGGRSIRVMGT